MRLILLKNLSGKKATVKKTTSDVFPDHSNRLQTKLARKNYRHFSYIFAHLQEWGVLQQNRDCHILSRRWSAGAVSRLWPRCCSNHARCPRVPMLSRSAIHASGIVVCERNSQANRITAPGKSRQRLLALEQLRPRRIQMHIITDRLEIPVAAPIHDQRLILAAKQVPELLVPPMVAAGIGAQQPLHPGHQVGLGRLDDQVKVVAHEAIRMHLPAGLLTRLRERLQEPLPVLVILENGLPPVAPIHHVINRPRILDAQLPSHPPRLALPLPFSQENYTISLTDPCYGGSGIARAVGQGGPRDSTRAREWCAVVARFYTVHLSSSVP